MQASLAYPNSFIVIGVMPRHVRWWGRLMQDAGQRGGVSELRSPTDSIGAHHVALIRRVADSSDRSAFADLYTYYAPRLKTYLRRLGSSEAAAEELVQEVMLQVWRKAALFDPTRAAVTTWIFTIARNKRIDALRRERRPEIEAGDPPPAVYDAPLAERALELAYDSERLQDALKTLPESQATVISMSFLEDKTHSMIADELDIPLGTVKSRLRLAFRRLRHVFGDFA